MKKAYAFFAYGGLRFLPLGGFLVMVILFLFYSQYLQVTPLPDSMVESVAPTEAAASKLYNVEVPKLHFPFAMSSLVLVALMLIMIGTTLVNIFKCSGKAVLKAVAILIACAGFVLHCYSDASLEFGNFPYLDTSTHELLNISNILMVLMLLILALSQSLLPEKALNTNVGKLKQRVRMFKVQIYLASLLLAVGLLEIFLLYYWRFGKEAAQVVVLGSGILYSGVMVVIFLPTAWLLHRSALQHISVKSLAHQRFRSLRKSFPVPSSSTNKPMIDEMPMLSPISGLGHYVAVFLPVLLGILPNLLGK